MIADLQAQLKEAERLLDATRHERDSLIVENSELKKTNYNLRMRLTEAETDTHDTKLELEMIEDLVKIG
jgi:regulator of replication initiation timing